jgi:hypothetical protein
MTQIFTINGERAPTSQNEAFSAGLQGLHGRNSGSMQCDVALKAAVQFIFVQMMDSVVEGEAASLQRGRRLVRRQDIRGYLIYTSRQHPCKVGFTF